MSKNTLHVGLDIGSTTIKTVVLDESLNVIYSLYRRHFSDTRRTMCDVLEELINKKDVLTCQNFALGLFCVFSFLAPVHH